MGLGWRVPVQGQPAFCPGGQDLGEAAAAEQLYSLTDGCFPQCIAPRAHHQRNSRCQMKGWSKSDWCVCCQLSRCTHILWVKKHYYQCSLLWIPHGYAHLLQTGCSLKVFVIQKAAKIFMCARRKPLLPTHNKDMFGEQLKSAMTTNHIWSVPTWTDTIWFPATEKYREGWGSRVQGSNAALGPAPGSLQPFTVFVAWQLVLTPPGASL